MEYVSPDIMRYVNTDMKFTEVSFFKEMAQSESILNLYMASISKTKGITEENLQSDHKFNLNMERPQEMLITYQEVKDYRTQYERE